jgi:hypothetical protein
VERCGEALRYGVTVKLRPLRRLHGLCLYCGRPSRADVCGFCSDLPLKDPLVHRARQPLMEAERMKAAG